jgi:endonuclease-3
LDEMPLQYDLDWLMKLPGVGYKTSAFVMLFVFRKPALPVDTHVHRVLRRLGVVGPKVKVSEAKAHQLLLDQLPADADELLNFHKLFFKHAQRICTWSYPKCRQCYLSDICRYYQQEYQS